MMRVTSRIEPAEGHIGEIGTILPNSGLLGIVVDRGPRYLVAVLNHFAS
jgi:hypothetical protein